MSVDFVFLDSGTGGLPYLLYLKKMCPTASCLYYADTINFPYGEKTNEEVVACALETCKKIIEKFSPRAIVIACNTISVNSLEQLRKAYKDTIFVGTVPAIKLAAAISKKRRIGLLATNSTIRHPYNQELKNKYASDCELVLRGDPELISFIEHKSFLANEDEKIKAIMPSIEYFKEQNCDVIILGCTHFLNLADLFEKVSAPDIKVVDSRDGVARRALDVVKIDNNQLPQKTKLFVSGFTAQKDEEEYKLICGKYGIELIK